MRTRQELLWDRWAVPCLALLLLLAGIFEYPRAIRKMHRSFDSLLLVVSIAGMVLAAGMAYWIGFRAKWLDQLERITPRYWFIAAIALGITPSLLGWDWEYRPVWRTSVPGVYLDPALWSMLAFFGWTASLRNKAKHENVSYGWTQASAVALLTVIWAGTVIHFGHNAFVVLAAILVTVTMLRGTHWFRASIVTVGVCFILAFRYIWFQNYLRIRIIAFFEPSYQPMGENFVSFQIRKSLEASGWFGGNSFTDLPGASHQFMMAVVGEHFGWLGLLLVVGIVTLLLLHTRAMLRMHSAGWLRYFSSAVLGFLILGSILNLIANFGLAAPAGLGIPFLARNLFLTGVSACLMGIAMREHHSTE